MVSLQGTPISPGYTEGIAVIHGIQRDIPIPHYRIEPAAVPSEQKRFESALQRASRELEHVRDRVLAEFGEAQSEIFSAHLALLNDKFFVSKVKERIARERVNVEYAIEEELNAAANQLLAAKDEYFRERAQDIRDVGHRLLRQLIPSTAGLLTHLPPRSVIVAHELLPSDTLDLDRRHVVAVITERGGTTSHAAIMAKALAVPAITNVAGAVARIKPGAVVLVDGETGQISADPSPAHATQFIRRKQNYESEAARVAAGVPPVCTTMDGVRIFLYGNIGRPHEAQEVRQHYLDGIGLFRTEFMFMEEREPPDRDRQERTYRAVADVLEGRPLVIRTLDLGGDKMPAFLAEQCRGETGLCPRGLRFALSVVRDLFMEQLDAIVHAAEERSSIRVLFPMVLGGSDFRRAVDLLRKAANGRAIPPVGAMIETPAALFDLHSILQAADFLSIGTNDLTQFMLAADRNAVDLFNDLTTLHPTVLRAVAQVVQAANAHNKPVAVCGEVGGDPKMARLLVGLGVRELSMSPARAIRVRYALRHATLSDLEQLAQQALQADSPAEVQQLLAEPSKDWKLRQR